MEGGRGVSEGVGEGRGVGRRWRNGCNEPPWPLASVQGWCVVQLSQLGLQLADTGLQAVQVRQERQLLCK